MNNQNNKQDKKSNPIYRTIGIVTISVAGILALISFIEFVNVFVLGNSSSYSPGEENNVISSNASADTNSIVNVVYGIIFLGLLAVSIWSLLKAKVKTLLTCLVLILIIGLSIFLIK